MDELANIPALTSVRLYDGATHRRWSERILAMCVDGDTPGQFGKSGCHSTGQRRRKGMPQGGPDLDLRGAQKNLSGELKGTVPQTDTGRWPHRSGKVYERTLV